VQNCAGNLLYSIWKHVSQGNQREDNQWKLLTPVHLAIGLVLGAFALAASKTGLIAPVLNPASVAALSVASTDIAMAQHSMLHPYIDPDFFRAFNLKIRESLFSII